MKVFGGIIGDIIGSVFEQNPIQSTNFPLFNNKSNKITDETVLIIAIMEWLLGRKELLESIQYWSYRYIDVKYYKPIYRRWLLDKKYLPMDSDDNGPASRVFPVGWAVKSLDEALNLAKVSTNVTNDNEEAFKGAKAIAAVIYMSRDLCDKNEIYDYVSSEFGYNLNKTIKSLRESFEKNDITQTTVPEAITCFLLADSFEEAIRFAVSLGNNSSSIVSMVGAMAEAYYGVPKHIADEAWNYIPLDMREVIEAFGEKFAKEVC